MKTVGREDSPKKLSKKERRKKKEEEKKVKDPEKAVPSEEAKTKLPTVEDADEIAVTNRQLATI